MKTLPAITSRHTVPPIASRMATITTRLFLCAVIVLMMPARRLAASSPDRAADAATDAALAFLARAQHPDGSFDESQSTLSRTALVLLAFLSNGHTPDAGQYGPTVRAAVDLIVARAPQDGYFGKLDNSRMYGQSLIVLALAQAYGVEPRPEDRLRIHTALTAAMKVILDAQNISKPLPFTGGWRDGPDATDSDLSHTGWCILALRACRNIGMVVPQDANTRAAEFVLRCYRPDQHAFAFQPDRPASPSMTAVALLTLHLATPHTPLDSPALSDLPSLRAVTDYLLKTPVPRNSRFSYSARYSVTRAAWLVRGPVWDSIWPQNRDALLSSQMPDGSWPASTPAEGASRIHSTAMSILTLSIPRALPPVDQP